MFSLYSSRTNRVIICNICMFPLPVIHIIPTFSYASILLLTNDTSFYFYHIYFYMLVLFIFLSSIFSLYRFVFTFLFNHFLINNFLEPMVYKKQFFYPIKINKFYVYFTFFRSQLWNYTGYFIADKFATWLKINDFVLTS